MTLSPSDLPGRDSQQDEWVTLAEFTPSSELGNERLAVTRTAEAVRELGSERLISYP